MAIVSCPHCQVHLQITADFEGHTLQCPNCQGAFVAPATERADTPDEDGLPLVVILTAVVIAHLLVFLVVAMAKGLGSAILLVTLAIVLEMTIWKRKELLAVFQESQTNRVVEKIKSSRSSQLDLGLAGVQSFLSQQEIERPTAQTPPIEVVAQFDDALVEIRPAKKVAARPRTISLNNQPPLRHARPSISEQAGGRSLGVNLPRDNIYFYGPGTELDLGRGVLKWPLVYATGLGQQGRFDVSLIDGTLPVAPAGSPVVECLPYWPSYYDCTPAQRAYYLNWLLSGKCDPDAELGYVFLYFYGLERRVLVDRADFLPIAQELVRLLPIYQASNSFRRYATALLWLTLYFASEIEAVPQSFLSQAVAATERWNDEALGIYLAILYNKNQTLPASVAFLVCQNDPRTSSSVVVRRHQEEFMKLFGAKYEKAFGDGIDIRTSKRLKRLEYQPASGSLLRSIGVDNGISVPSIPDVLGISSQFKPLIQFWNDAVDDLKAYSRASRASGGELTAEAYEALPSELQTGDHPEMDAWLQVWEQHADTEGWPIVPISALCTIKQTSAREKLTKSQCTKLLTTADALGFGVEPDARMTGRNYFWDERVALFFLDEVTSADSTNYVAASVLLRLGATIAEADGNIDKSELNFITNHLEGQFNLSNADSKRLERLKYLLLHSKSGENTISSTLAKRLPRQHRLLIGEFLVGVAATDEIITEGEVKELRKAYKLLDLKIEDLDRLLAVHAAPAETSERALAPDAELRLDMQAISRIMTETREVAGILRDAMADEDESLEEDEASTAVAVADASAQFSSQSVAQPDSGTDDGLDPRYRTFLSAVLKESEWTPARLRTLADSCSVMLSGAIEAINEWSTDRYGDWLIVEGDTYQVQQDLVREALPE